MDQHLGAFWREAQLLSRLNHPNVLRMYGVVCESEADPTIRGIMTEYASGGSLSANLRCVGCQRLQTVHDCRLLKVACSNSDWQHAADVSGP